MTAEDESVVRITLRDVYKAQLDQGHAFAEMTGKLDLVLAGAKSDKEATETAIAAVKADSDKEISALKVGAADRETRIRALEYRVWTLPSLAVITAAISLVKAFHLGL